MTEDIDDDGRPDQDAEPTLNAPAEAGPTGTDGGGGGGGTSRGSTEEAEDQDAEPTRNAPGDAGPAGPSGS